jgi:hypothetical protein
MQKYMSFWVPCSLDITWSKMPKNWVNHLDVTKEKTQIHDQREENRKDLSAFALKAEVPNNTEFGNYFK